MLSADSPRNTADVRLGTDELANLRPSPEQISFLKNKQNWRLSPAFFQFRGDGPMRFNGQTVAFVPSLIRDSDYWASNLTLAIAADTYQHQADKEAVRDRIEIFSHLMMAVLADDVPLREIGGGKSGTIVDTVGFMVFIATRGGKDVVPQALSGLVNDTILYLGKNTRSWKDTEKEEHIKRKLSVMRSLADRLKGASTSSSESA